jgi:hypothetical protein
LENNLIDLNNENKGEEIKYKNIFNRYNFAKTKFFKINGRLWIEWILLY